MCSVFVRSCKNYAFICLAERNCYGISASQMTTYLFRLSLLQSGHTTGATCRAEIAYPFRAPEFTPVVSGVRVDLSLVFSLLFCTFFWSLCCLSFFELQFLITPLISYDFSCGYWVFFTYA